MKSYLVYVSLIIQTHLRPILSPPKKVESS